MSSINAQADAAFWNFAKKSRGAMQDVTKMVLIETYDRLLYRSPVGNPTTWKQQPPYTKGYLPGHFINNWQLGVDVVPTNEIPGSDPSGNASRRRMRQAIPRWPLGHVYYFVNNAPYASALENGHSAQCPPGGMVGLTRLEFQSIVADCERRYALGERPGLKSEA
jgi:hypothetical protein